MQKECFFDIKFLFDKINFKEIKIYYETFMIIQNTQGNDYKLSCHSRMLLSGICEYTKDSRLSADKAG